jgi:hypothetical protein
VKGIKRFIITLTFGIVGIVLIGYCALATPKEVEAACGASTSSCKTCHEVQGADPVSKKGDWHTQHAFGDFCQACHLGVATETDKTKAHTGIVAKPLGQPDQSCASCHPADTAARVAKYGGTATTANPAGGTSSPSSSSAAGTASSAGTGSITPSPAANQVPPSSNPNFDLIDFNSNGKLSWLTWAIIVADILALMAIAVLLWKWRTGLWPWANLKGKRKNVPFNSLPTEAQDVVTKLLAGDMQTVLALQKILEGQQGSQLLEALNQLPIELVLQLQRMNEDELRSLSLSIKNGKGEF